MFHCDRWCFPWAVTAAGGTHVCLCQLDPASIWRLFDDEGVTHYSGSPTVQTSLVHHADARRVERRVTATAVRPSACRQGQGYTPRTRCGSSTSRCTTCRAIGEVVMRGNNVMAGYFADEDATQEAFRGGWFHSGDLAAWHADGAIELRDLGKRHECVMLANRAYRTYPMSLAISYWAGAPLCSKTSGSLRRRGDRGTRGSRPWC